MTNNITLQKALEQIIAQKEMCILSVDDVYFGMCEYCSVEWCPKYIAHRALYDYKKAIAPQGPQQKTFTVEELTQKVKTRIKYIQNKLVS